MYCHVHTLPVTLIQVVKKRKSVKVDTYLPSIAEMTDNDLVEELERYGINSGPITDTTRGVYQRKLAKLMSEKATGKCLLL